MKIIILDRRYAFDGNFESFGYFLDCDSELFAHSSKALASADARSNRRDFLIGSRNRPRK